MNNGLYVAASGLLMQQRRVDVISNNMANTDTNGFRRELAVFSDYRPVDKRFPQNWIQKSTYNRTINNSVKLDDVVTDHDAGHMKLTENKFDMALMDKNNFFAVETPFGIKYTRDGAFTVNTAGELVTRDGFNLLDRQTGAPIIIPPDHREMAVTTDGTIYINGAPVTQIDIARFEDLNYLQKTGRNLYTAVGILPETPENYALVQGFLESSNVNPITEMVNMIEAVRAYEMYSKVVHTYDSLNEHASNSIGRAG